MYDILALVNGGVPKTRIVYQANLNFKFAKPYFDFLLAKGYMTRNPASEEDVIVYKLTEKGEHLLGLLQTVEVELEDLFFPRSRTNEDRRDI